MGANFDVKILIIFLLVAILVLLVGLTVNVLKDHKSSFKFYKTIMNEKDKKEPPKKDSKE
ncbi:hypothetical protein C1T31_12210 [Hanstruepera neustonica]|uniref:Uncharacterized protein n=1 Tax=Hanstruepera neustonica TaxID=1445657 RepID=A0A2K1DW97_9FLAO|nr:hypothetical protein [Hanstruepera neustonica]PNQ72308.1 hypothetical protein C1T31_12210 [Hanstruepera neustonica]